MFPCGLEADAALVALNAEFQQEELNVDLPEAMYSRLGIGVDCVGGCTRGRDRPNGGWPREPRYDTIRPGPGRYYQVCLEGAA